jgi:hypothetical protein
MTNKMLICVLVTALLAIAACSKTATTPTTNSNATAATSPAAKKDDKTKSLPPSKVVPVPANWITMSDEQKGYQFEVPEGSQKTSQTANGIDVFVATSPEPSKVAVMVMAFKDKNASKEDLFKFAEKLLSGMGEKDIKIGAPTEISDDYSVATLSSVDEKGETTKGKVLVATDVTDNYVMLLGSPEKEYAANEKIIDAIWGSFSMHSGGYSGKSD